jgi:hypothetical protein
MPLRHLRRGKAARESIVAVSQKTCPSSDANGAPDPGMRQVRHNPRVRSPSCYPVRHPIRPDRQEGERVPNTDECERTPHRARGSPVPWPFVSPWPAFWLPAIHLTTTSRLVPRRPNVTLIGAIALFGSASFADHRAAFLAPALARGEWLVPALHDRSLGGHSRTT